MRFLKWIHRLLLTGLRSNCVWTAWSHIHMPLIRREEGGGRREWCMPPSLMLHQREEDLFACPSGTRSAMTPASSWFEIWDFRFEILDLRFILFSKMEEFLNGIFHTKWEWDICKHRAGFDVCLLLGSSALALFGMMKLWFTSVNTEVQ